MTSVLGEADDPPMLLALASTFATATSAEPKGGEGVSRASLAPTRDWILPTANATACLPRRRCMAGRLSAVVPALSIADGANPHQLNRKSVLLLIDGYYASMAKHVLAASNSFRASHIELYDFALPAAAGMWNLRWQVRGYVDAKPSVSATELSSRFVFGSGLSYRNLRAPFVDRGWDEQQDQFARFLLMNLVSLYEGYVEELEIDFEVKGVSKSLQFPSKGVLGRGKPGVREAIATLSSNPSAVMKKNFRPVAISHPRYQQPNIDDLMLMFRYFKEVRNAFAHANGVVKDYMVASSTAAKSLRDDVFPSALPSRIPALIPGQHAKVSWREVQSFSEVLLWIVSTIDAELCGTARAERQLLQDWASRFDARSDLRIPSDPVRRQRWLSNHVVALGYPRPADPSSLEALLKGAGFLSDRA